MSPTSAHHTSIDLCVDGADEIQRDSLDLVKGLGGALLREKLVASAARRLVIIADSSKLVDRLGTTAPIPVEVTPFAWQLTLARLAALSREVTRRVQADGAPYLTDGGNYIVDCTMLPVADAGALDRALRDIVGVVETGLFIGMATLALVAGDTGIRPDRTSMTADAPLVLVVMGVSGSGKSTIAQGMDDALHWPFQEGDALHPAGNVAKMRAGTPLTDADRAPWLHAIRAWIDDRVAAGEHGLVTCSALKRAYRDLLVGDRGNVRLLYLQADPALLRQRLERRTGHFMPSSLLDSQLSTLEEPQEDERPLIVAVHGSVAETVADAVRAVRSAGQAE